MDSLISRFRAWLTGLTEQEYKELWNKLQCHTNSRFRWLRMIYGIDLENLIDEAILSALEGKRRWKEDDEDPVNFLCEIINSKANHEWEKVKRRRPGSDAPSSQAGAASSLPPPPDDEHADPPQFRDIHPKDDAYRLWRDSQREFDHQALLDRAFTLIGNDSLVRKIFEIWASNSRMKPQGFAAVLGESVKEVRNAKKRLNRIIAKLRKEFGDE